MPRSHLRVRHLALQAVSKYPMEWYLVHDQRPAARRQRRPCVALHRQVLLARETRQIPVSL